MTSAVPDSDAATYSARLLDHLALQLGEDAVWCHTSKNVAFAEAFTETALRLGHDVRTAQIVRDPRGVALSSHRGWRRNKDDGSAPSFKKLVATSIRWRTINAGLHDATAPHAPHQSFLYEALASSEPERMRFLGFLGLTYDGVLRHRHVLSGNPSREANTLVFKPDVEWPARLSALRQTVAYVAALPMSRSHGLPLLRSNATASQQPTPEPRGTQGHA